MRRFHIALAVKNLAESVADYSRRLGCAPSALVPGKYAMWRTGTLNFSISELPGCAGQLRHLGFECDSAQGFTREVDVNGLEWECFSSLAQDEKIIESYGTSVV